MEGQLTGSTNTCFLYWPTWFGLTGDKCVQEVTCMNVRHMLVVGGGGNHTRPQLLKRMNSLR